MSNIIEKARVPRYVEVKNDLLKRIDRGEYPPRFKIPSENELTKIYGVSVITTRKALSDLTNEGKISRIKGKGSFVSDFDNTKNVKTRLKIITLSVLMYENSDSSTMQIIRGAQLYLSKNGYSLIVECCHDDVMAEAQILEKCIENDIDGVLLFSANPNANITSLKKLREKQIPFVLIDRGISQFPASLVSSYNIDGTYKLANYLIENGHTKIIFASENINFTTENNRLQGYKMALEENGIQFRSELCIDKVSGNLDNLYEIYKKQNATAIICVNDKSAVMIMNYLKSKGVDVPGDVSVSGFDDADFGKYATPSLTTIRQPFSEIGSRAAEKLVDLIENDNVSHTQLFLPIHLIIRDSTAPVTQN